MQVVFVHGALVRDGAWWWSRTAPLLAAHGLASTALELPSCAGQGGLHTDADALKALLANTSDQVILVGHSYGGMVVTDAGGAPNVRHLVYVTSFLAETTQPLASFGPEPAPHVQFHPDGTVSLRREDLRHRFAQDCDEQAYQGALARLTRQSQLALTQPPRHAAWQTKPSTYVVCARDRGTLPEVQRAQAELATEVVELDSDHHPFLSQPAKFAEVLLDISRR
ncbi:alpha/beta hydrolase [Crossiella sp. NPDC003009]